MTSVTSLDQFDLLGIGGREDCYSDLLGHAFALSPAFRERFLRDLLEIDPGPDPDGWQALVRPGITPVDLACCDGPPAANTRRPDVPDLVFYQREQGIAVAVVNQLFVTDAPDRTEHFASLAHRSGLAELLGIENPTFHSFFLSLRGARPASPEFRPFSYQALCSKVIDRLPRGNGALDVLLAALLDRVSEYYGRRPPADDEALKAHLRYRHRLVFSYRNFEVFAASLFPGFHTEVDVASNMECCYIPLQRAWKTTWLAYPQYPEESTCYSAHYELQWHTRLDRLNLYFHVESISGGRSGATLCLLRQPGDTPAARFQLWRRSFYEHLAGHHARLEAAGWNMRRSFVALMSAQLPLADATTAREVRDRVGGMLETATPLIDAIVAEAIGARSA